MVDVALKIEVLPERGHDALSSERLVTAGGGFNVMSAVTRQGVPALYAGQLGTGQFSQIARHSLAGEGIATPVAASTTKDLGACIVLVEATGERTFVTSPGAELTLTLSDLAVVHPGAGDIVYFSGYNIVYDELRGTITQWLRGFDAEVVVAFDPGPRVADIDPATLEEVLQRTDWLLCNAVEAEILTGETTIEEAAEALFERWGRSGVVVRAGDQGCIAVTADEVLTAPGFSTTVVDTNGAGDVHNGVVLAEMMRATPLGQALARANAAAAIAIASFGPATCPDRDEVSRRLVAEPVATIVRPR